MRRILGHLSAILITLAIASPSATIAQEVTYDRIVFLREHHGSGSNTWTQLQFRIEGFRINGDCYRPTCRIAFHLDSNIGRYHERTDIGVRGYSSWLGGATVSTDLPFVNGQIFFGSNSNSSASRAAIRLLSERERIAIAWIAASSQELIQYAIDDGIDFGPARDAWQNNVVFFETRLLGRIRELESTARRLSRLVNSQQELSQTIQPALARMGLYTAEIDGLRGPATDRAVRAFQRDNERLETGYVDATEFEMLRDYLAESQPQAEPQLARETYDLRDAVEDAVEAQTELRAANARIAALEAELAGAQAENERLETSVARTLENLGDARETITVRSQRVTELLVARDALAEQLERARREVNRQAVRLSQLEDTVEELQSFETALETTSDELAAAQAENTELREQIAELQAGGANPAIGDGGTNISGLQAELAQQTAAVVVARQTASNRLATIRAQEEQIAALEGQLTDLFETDERAAELARQLAAANGTIADQQEAIAELEAESAALASSDERATELEAELAEARQDLLVANEEITGLQTELAVLQNADGQATELARQLAAANGTIADQQADLVSLREEIAGLQSDSERADSLALELEQTIATLEEQMAQVGELEADLADLQGADERATELTRQLTAANGTLADLYERIAELEAETALLGDVENRASELQRQLNTANETIAVQSDRIDGLESQTEQLQAYANRVPELERQLAGANGTIADLRDNIESDERVVAIRRSLEAANTTIADLRASIEEQYVAAEDYAELERQLTAAGSTIADLREQMSEEYVTVAMYAELQRQLNGSNQTIADLREEMETDFIPSEEHENQIIALNVQMSDLRSQLDAAMTTIADLRESIETDYVPLADMREALRQLRALNGALVELQEANTVLRARVIESDQLFANFRDDCRAQPECARAMRLD